MIDIHCGADPIGEPPGHRDNEYSRAGKGKHRPKRPFGEGKLERWSECGVGETAHTSVFYLLGEVLDDLAQKGQ